MSNDFKISLGLSSLRKCFNLNLDYSNQTAVLNGEPFKMDVRPFMDKICNIVTDWEEKLINLAILDGLAYHIFIQKDGKIKKYEGRNKFPPNFNEFLNLLSEVNLC